jgi:hypothetical protein
MLEGGKRFPTVALFLLQLSSEKPHNNRIHSNKQGRAAVTFAKFEENVVFTNARFPACR